LADIYRVVLKEQTNVSHLIRKLRKKEQESRKEELKMMYTATAVKVS